MTPHAITAHMARRFPGNPLISLLKIKFVSSENGQASPFEMLGLDFCFFARRQSQIEHVEDDSQID